MLKGIPAIISPELMKVMMEMGHGDELVIADGNFPAASHTTRLIDASGHQVPEMLEAILQFLPLDTYVEQPLSLMKTANLEESLPTIWSTYQSIVQKYEWNNKHFEYVERFDFYERAKKAYAVVSTGEKALYANIILKKGVVI